MIKKILNVIYTIEKRIIQVLFIAMTLVVLAAIANRLTFNRQMAWSDEFSRYTFIWMTFFAAAYATGQNAHIGVTALFDALPAKAQYVLQFFLYLFGLAFSVVICWYGYQIMMTQASYGQLSPSMRLPMQYAYLGMVLGALLMVVHYVLHIIQHFTERPGEELEKGDGQ